MPDRRDLLSAALRLILAWYPTVRRPLPWRQDPTPYHTWVAEIMLQQTRIEAVLPYYTRFLNELPDLQHLAAVPEDRLMKLWEGLGYYSRARNLKKTAVLLLAQYGGSLPASAEELRKLPGIGDYTAGAIASIAFGLPEPAVDGNVLRVVTRLLACGDDITDTKTRRTVTEWLRSCYPGGRDAGLVTEGIMELGETVCLPNGLPHCEACPLQGLCAAHAAGKELAYPVRTAPRPRRVEEKTVLLLRRGNCFAVRRRPKTGLLAGLWEFPNADGRLTPEQAARLAESFALTVRTVVPCGNAKHVFTHVEWQMTGFLLDCTEISPADLPLTASTRGEAGREGPLQELKELKEPGDLLWKTPAALAEEVPLPTAFRPWQKKLGELG